MTINVSVTVDRRVALFFTGEKFLVQITFKNNSSEGPKSLAWGCVQLHCEENLTNKPGDAERRRHNASTAVTRSKQAIFSSEPVILFCDILIQPGGSQTFENTQQIPIDMPPSFKGLFTKYVWYISVAAQQVDAPIKMVHLPIKVLNVGVDVSTPKGPSVENPFLRKEIQGPSLVEIAVNRIEEVCSIRKQRVYEIKNGGKMFATVVMFKNVFKLGDYVIGKFEFPQNEIHCLQTLIRAEIVETNLNDEKKAQNVTALCTEHMISAFVRETHFKVHLPMTASPSFTTETVKVRWRLKFEFVTTTQEIMRQQGQDTLKLADDLSIETVNWEVPISVLSCNLFNACLVINNVPSTTSFNI